MTFILRSEVLNILLTPEVAITTAADDKFCDIFPNFRKNKVQYYMRIVMKYHALFVIFEKHHNLKLSSAVNYMRRLMD